MMEMCTRFTGILSVVKKKEKNPVCHSAETSHMPITNVNRVNVLWQLAANGYIPAAGSIRNAAAEGSKTEASLTPIPHLNPENPAQQRLM